MMGDVEQWHLVQEISKCGCKFGGNLALYIGSLNSVVLNLWVAALLSRGHKLDILCITYLHYDS